jgi:sec-independent protein translocase protein TatC
VAFPFIMMFFASFNSIDLKFMPKLEDVFGLYTKMLIGIGIVFQMPTVVYFLAKMRVVTARFLARNFKYAFLLIFVVAAVITPTGDPMTQTIFAAPMVALYGLASSWRGSSVPSASKTNPRRTVRTGHPPSSGRFNSRRRA